MKNGSSGTAFGSSIGNGPEFASSWCLTSVCTSLVESGFGLVSSDCMAEGKLLVKANLSKLLLLLDGLANSRGEVEGEATGEFGTVVFGFVHPKSKVPSVGYSDRVSIMNELKIVDMSDCGED